jgi:hypothetical protein
VSAMFHRTPTTVLSDRLTVAARVAVFKEPLLQKARSLNDAYAALFSTGANEAAVTHFIGEYASATRMLKGECEHHGL